MNLTQMLVSVAQAHATKEAIRFEKKSYSFQDMITRICRVSALLARLGVKKGDRVALQLQKSMDFIFFHLANLAVGAVTLPISPFFKETEVEYFLKDSQSSLFVTHESNYLTLRAAIDSLGFLSCLLVDGRQPGALCYEEELEHVANAPVPDYSAQDDDVALICYTSGTTGRPKGAMITHKNLISNMRAIQQAWQWKDQDILLHTLPIFHVHGLEVALQGGLHAGSTIIMQEKFDPLTVWRTIEKERCTLFMGVPTMYFRLLNQWAAMGPKPDIRSMRLFISGSAPLSEKLFARFQSATGHTILERYGMTETGMIATNPLAPEQRIAGSVGYAFPGIQICLTDADGNQVEAGQVGEVCIRGDNVFKGYWKAPEKTKETFRGPWLKSGDLGCQDPHDQMRLYLKGRIKELIITKGYNVYPKEIENVIDQHEAVAESAVIGLPDEDAGEKIVAVVVLKPEMPPIPGEQLMDFCKHKLAGYKCPAAFYFQETLPRNTMGKVQKHVLINKLS